MRLRVKQENKKFSVAYTTELLILIILFALTMLLLGEKAIAYTVTPSSVSFSWTAPGDDGSTGQAAGYDIRYSTSMINASNWDQANRATGEPTPQIAGMTETFTVNGLSPAQTYYFALKTVDESGNFSAMSNVFSATTSLTLDTDADVTIISPLNGAVVGESYPTLTIQNIDTQSTNTYLFEVATDSSFVAMVDASASVSQQTGSTTSWRVTEKLTSGVDYYWRSIANGTDYSDIYSFTVEPQTHVYPNPFRLSQVNEVTFTEVPAGAELMLMTISGREVRIWSNTTGDDITWDGTNSSGNPVGSDTYIWFVGGTDLSGKIVLIR